MCIPLRHGPYTHLTRPLLALLVLEGADSRDCHTLTLLSTCAYILTGRKRALNIAMCVNRIYSVCTALIERVVKTGSGCALIREYALMRDMRLITREYGMFGHYKIKLCLNSFACSNDVKR